MHKLALTAALAAAQLTMAQNPVICDRYTPDPAPFVYNDTLFLFVDHDGNEDTGYFNMPDWLLYSTTDMANWTYRGTPVTTATFKKWAKQDNDAWAAQCIERDGKWWWYVTATVEGRGYPGIGVAVADSPTGPYKDALGKPLAEGWFYIDPTVFIDDDGQAYLFWGNNNLWYGKLSKTMRALTGITKVNTLDESAFGPYKGYEDDGTPKTNYEEAPWIYRRGDTYYLEYAAGGVPEHWAYATAKSIKGPWTYQGKVMGTADGSFTIHGGSVDFKGHSYMFYHNGKLPGGGGFKRSTCVEEFVRGEDGSIPFIPFTSTGVAQLENLNPRVWQEAETINQSSGILCVGDGSTNYVTNISRDGFIRVKGVDFGDGTLTGFTARVAATQAATMYVRSDKQGGKILAKVKIADTGGLDNWQEVRAELTSVPTGVHDLYFTFAGTVKDKTLFVFDSWMFDDTPSGIASPTTRKDSADDKEYDTNGILLSPQSPHHGVVVKGGKKFIKQ